MKSKLNRKDQFSRHTGVGKKTHLPLGYPLYPTGEISYNRFDIESELNAKDISPIPDHTGGFNNEKVLNTDTHDSDPDISGVEPDDPNEDEASNYFSLGEDHRNALEED